MRMKRPRFAVASLSVIAVVGVVAGSGKLPSIVRWISPSKGHPVAVKNPELTVSGKDELNAEAEHSRAAQAVKLEQFDVVVGQIEQNADSRSEAQDKQCASLEFAGAGPELTEVDASLWARFMVDYRQIKEELVGWLHQNAEFFPSSQLAKMELEIRQSRVMRPQAQLQPDLSWRGVAVWTRPQAGTIVEGERPALIQVGDGFLKLYQKDRSRARFELTRVLAQAWAPCELGNGKSSAAWDSVLQCLGFSKNQIGCAAGVVSETAWATSSAVAVLLNPPACELPAFQGGKLQSCLGGFKRTESVSYEVERTSRNIASKSEGKAK